VKEKIRIKILGTAAAEGIPALFCNCKLCQHTHKTKGKNIRSRSSILIDKILKIDLPPDTFYHSIIHKIDTSNIKYIFITHSHFDHLSVKELIMIQQGFAKRTQIPPLQIYGNSDVIKIINQLKKQLNNPPIKLNTLTPFQKINIDNYTIIPVKAIHGEDKNPLNYIIIKNNKKILYACDTGIYTKTTWEKLKNLNIHFDLVISECTYGPLKSEWKSHLGLPDVIEFRKKMESIKLINESTKWILTHFSHNCQTDYYTMKKLAKPYNFTVAYDGIKIKL